MNTFGTYLRLTTFGESHGPAIGGVLDGFPAGVAIDFDKISQAIAERATATGTHVSARREPDIPEWLSGIHPDGRSLGSPIAFIVRNSDCRSSDYDNLRDVYRPGHADYTWEKKYGLRDHRGGGRASARETVSRVIAGALAAQIPEMSGIEVTAMLESVGNVHGSIDTLIEEIERVRMEQDSIGGVVSCTVTGLPVGIGDPVFDKLQAHLASAVMSIPAVRSFEFGLGAVSATLRGSESMDKFIPAPGMEYFDTVTNFCGGIQGGISNGMPVVMKVAFHATPTISRPVETVNSKGEPAVIEIQGRHDPCVAFRGAAVVKGMVRLALADMLRSPNSSLSR